MADELFILGLTVFLTWMFSWGFKSLPDEKWQILAAMPKTKDRNGGWHGENLTYYGFFNANAYVFSIIIFIVLLGAVSVPSAGILSTASILLGVCIPSSKIVAKIVEKKSYTFTVGGASFVGVILAPAVVWLGNMSLGRWMNFEMPMLPFLAALGIAYAFGEGAGRLACISFGCCYGKPLCDCPSLLQKLFAGKSFIFSGKTKKIAYASGLDGRQVIPIQALTSVIYCAAGLAGIYLFLKGFYGTAFLGTLLVTQLWRSLSECLRADYRGQGKISAYQIMALAATVYAALLVLFIPSSGALPTDIVKGLRYLWHPGMLLFLQGLWIAVFLHTGRSKVTGSSLSFHVIKDRV
jgi:hypothetical protein